MKIKNVILDMAEVLMSFRPEILLNKYLDHDEDRQIIWEELYDGEEGVLRDLGRITLDEQFKRVAERVPMHLHRALYQCIYGYMERMIPIPEARDFCIYCKEKGYHLFVLSNASESFYEFFPKFMPVTFFDGVVVSADVHVRKPDRKIYEYILQKYQLKSEECLFIDDRKENIAAAEQIGMQGWIHNGNFENIKQKFLL